MMMMVAEEPPKENVTARSQVRDDGQTHRRAIRPQEAGFCG
jgi:hypothetical protein